MPQIHTHYDNLKVARNAPPEVIRAAYKTLSQKFHPDRNPDKQNATRTFQMISLAYEVLSDPAKRRAHDEWIIAEEAKEQPPDNFQDVYSPSRTGRQAMPQSTGFQAFASSRKEWQWPSLSRLFKYFFWLLLPTLILLIVVTV
jgi:DnaJ-class molecular chaperone